MGVLDSAGVTDKDRERYLRSVAFATDGKLLAFGMDGGRLKLWRLRLRSK